MRTLALVSLLYCVSAVSADDLKEPTPKQAEFFQKQVRPVLETTCFKCHSHQANKSKGNLVVDSLASLLKGGESGPAVVPGQPDKSLLVKAIRHEADDLQMPPGAKLAPEKIAVLVEWVKMGVPWPGASKQIAGHIPGKITEEDRKWWSFQPLKAITPPTVADAVWGKNPIDRFIRARLKTEGLAPAPAADRLTLIRRVSFDVIGLPPTPEEIDAFVSDPAADAYEKLIDRLLASPRYGEKWARHWLDLVRYAESDGYRLDEYRPTAWRFRDYVIRSLNADKPFDRFLREQLAGDELYPDDPDALAATAYLRHWIYEYNQRDARAQWQVILDDITDTTAEAFLGLGMGCARCHDHKFDPILQKDYFRLQAFFAAIQPDDYQSLVTPAQRKEYYEKLNAWKAKADPILKQIETMTRGERNKIANTAIDKFQPDIQAILRMPESQRSPFEKQLAALAYRQVTYEFDKFDKKVREDKTAKYAKLNAELANLEGEKPAPLPYGFAVRDVGPEAPPIYLPKKIKGDPVAPGYLTILDERPAAIIPPVEMNSTGRRTALANWLTRPDQPLTARVIVNRIWQQHFGQGIVNTPSDFGRLGEKPSHPELLDWLAHNFVQEGWSFKKLHRDILTSQTYRQSATAPAPEIALKKDPQNRLLWRMATRRLDAEQIRDAILAVNGRLDLKEGGPSVDAAKPRRTIYTKTLRNTRDPLLDVFDVPELINSSGLRNVTTTPTQALLMINSPFMVEQATSLAKRLDKAKEGRIDAAFRLTFGRAPTEGEKQLAQEFLHQQTARIDPKSAAPPFQYAKMPFREGRAALMQPGAEQPRLMVTDTSKMPTGDFTLEAFVVLKSVYDDAKVRPIAAHGNAETGPGWVFGVTSKKTTHKPQTLVLQMWGENDQGKKEHEPVFSDVRIDLNKPYYVAVTVKVGDTGKTGVTFYAKDLSNDEDPMHVFQAPHKIVKMPPQRGPFHLGSGAAKAERHWDGLIDDVRLSSGVLREDQMLLASEAIGNQTAAFWQFEPTPGAFKDSSSNGFDLSRDAPAAPVNREAAAWIDFCQVLLNANEFLYVD
jgi:hypothetical protein